IGRFTIDRLLGSGAMGCVYLGRDPELDRAVAIKTIRDLGMERENLDTFLERFRNEARAAARLTDPTIVQVFDVGEDAEAGPYLVFEYVAGSTLKQMLRSQPAIGPERTIHFARQIARALTVAHANEVLHRDLKPDNLLVTPDDELKLADFGVARVPNASLTRKGQFLGTPCYAAPETLAEGQYSPKSDLFSFAAVLYEMISGHRAFPGDDAVAVAHQVIHDDPKPPSKTTHQTKIPATVDQVLLKALSKRPEDRYGCPNDLVIAFEDAWAKAGRVVPGGFDSRAPAERRTQTQRFGALLTGLVVLGLVAFGISMMTLFKSPNAQRPNGGERQSTRPGLIESTQRTLLDGEPIGLEEQIRDETRQTAGAHLAEESGLEGAPPTLDGAQASQEADPAREVTPAAIQDSSAIDEEGRPEVDSSLDLRTPHEREEAAKEALGRARAALSRGDATLAHAALKEATLHDPENPDIEALWRRLPNELQTAGSH
ncbi:MAG: serine/threonine-protein kinase, partial [Myxococcota bacterium]